MFYYGEKPIKRVGFLGVGTSNIGVYRYLTSHYPNLDITLRASTPSESDGIIADRCFFGEDMLRDIDEDILFLSPSARRDTPALLHPKNRDVIYSSDCELFFQNTKSRVVGITGSDGKSTTTYITSKLLSESGTYSIPFGNFGEAMTPHLDDTLPTLYIAELSSFQLSYKRPHTAAAAITNITKNHLNWHKDFDEYIQAKRNILENTERRIFNFDCEISRRLLSDYAPFAVYSTALSENELRRLVSAELYVTLSGGKIYASGEELLDTADIFVPGKYNVSNYMCAISLSYGDLSKSALKAFAREFGGLPHRREYVGNFSGVDYYNSSIDSSPKRCIATLSSFSTPVILILGGRKKGLEFDELIPHVKKHARLTVLTGESAPEIEELCKKENINYVRIDGFCEAVLYAIGASGVGDTVLLSPAATSYDTFKNFEERGRFFKELVKSKG